MGKGTVGEGKVGKGKWKKGKWKKEKWEQKKWKRKSGNNETFVIHTKECSTGQIMGEEKMGGLKGKWDVY